MSKKKKNHNVKQQETKKAVETVVETKEKVEENDTVKIDNAQEKITNKLDAIIKRMKGASPESIRTLEIAALKVVLPVVAMIIVIATIVSLVKTKNEKQEEEAVAMTDLATEATVDMEPLELDAYPEVNAIMSSYYNALASGDMETVKSLMDYISETDLIQLKNKNEFVESYNDINCYTRQGIDDSSYFVYVTYKAKFNGFETMVPGVTTHYVYTSEGGSLTIAKEMNEQVNEALMLTSCQDDVVDIFNKVDVEYKEILAANEDLNTFLTEMSGKAKTMTGEEIAKLEVGEETTQTEEGMTTEETAVEEATETIVVEQPQTQIVNEEVKTTATVNVRSSDSENADKIGRAETGTILKRTESKINGWSKVIFEGKEAFIKSDYLEVVSSNPVEENTDNTTETTDEDTVSSTETQVSGLVIARTNVNVRNKPSQEADTIGVAEGGSEYKVLEDQGEWLKIEYKGQTGFVKAEYFD